MLSTAEKYQKTFYLLGEDEHNHFVVPQTIDWENGRAFVTFLQTFYDATFNFYGSTYVTSNSYFLQLCIIQHTLNDGCLSLDQVLSFVSFNMKNKYKKGDYGYNQLNVVCWFCYWPTQQDKGVGVLVEKMQWACVGGSNRSKSERPPKSFN